VHGGGDGLPGITLDRYGAHLVLGVAAEIDERLREAALDAAHALGADGVYLKVRPRVASTLVDTRRDEVAPKAASRGDSAPEAFTAREGELRFQIRLGDGLSTGVFLDQRDNRERVRELSQGARVLNLFAYTGAFTVAAIVGGARATVTVDAAGPATDAAIRNVAAARAQVGADDPAAHAVVKADAFDWLRRAAAKSERFDVIVVDPPSFATTKKSRFRAASDFADLAAQCLAVLAPGGTLVACTNHRGLSTARFRRDLHEACRLASRESTKVRDAAPPSDFPPEPGDEPHLKTVLLTVSHETGTPRPAPRPQASAAPRGAQPPARPTKKGRS